MLDAALVLLADHELAASTVAARVAASVRADPYAVVSAGLATVSGTLHGGASLGIEALLDEIDRPERAATVVGDRLRRGERLRGFGHRLYPDGDPRAGFLLARLRATAAGSPRMAVVDALLEATTRRGLPEPNVDLALAALAHVTAMTRGAAEAIFAVARTAGWIAHALEEYDRNTPIRPRAVYTGPAPGSCAPRRPEPDRPTWRGPGRGWEPAGWAGGGGARDRGGAAAGTAAGADGAGDDDGGDQGAGGAGGGEDAGVGDAGAAAADGDEDALEGAVGGVDLEVGHDGEGLAEAAVGGGLGGAAGALGDVLGPGADLEQGQLLGLGREQGADVVAAGHDRRPVARRRPARATTWPPSVASNSALSRSRARNRRTLTAPGVSPIAFATSSVDWP